jgi:hypothetical protein
MFESRLRSMFWVLLSPSEQTFDRIKIDSQGTLGSSVPFIAAGVAATFMGMSILAGIPVDPIETLWVALILTAAAIIWSASALVLSGRFRGQEALTIEPFMFLGSTSLLLLFLVSSVVAFLPQVGIVLSVLALAYMQLLVLLAEKWWARAGAARALLATFLSPVVASVGAIMVARIVVGMPRFLESGWLR